MIIKEVETKNVLTKSNLPVSDYSANPYVGCSHACKYCYASFMKRFTNHPERMPLYEEIYQHGSRLYWEALDSQIREYALENGLEYARDDDNMQNPFDAPPVVVNFFYLRAAACGQKNHGCSSLWPFLVFARK